MKVRLVNPFKAGLAVRMVTLVLIAVLLAQIITTLLLTTEHRGELQRERFRGAVSRVGEVARLLEQLPHHEGRRLLRTISTRSVQYWLSSHPAVEMENAEPALYVERRLSRHFQEVRARRTFIAVSSAECDEWRRFRADRPAHPSGYDRHRRWDHDDDDDHDDDRECGPLGLRIAVKLDGPRWLNVAMTPAEEVRKVAIPALTSLGVTSVILVGLVLLIATRLSRPLNLLAGAAEALGRGETPEKLPEDGPREVAATAKAFNRMSERLDRFVRDRTRLLAAISHDLRTPITSLRLRAEFVEEEGLREKILASLDEMQAMTEATLAFAREDATSEETRPTDLSALVDSLCDDQIDLGREVAFQAPERLVARCRPLALKRALRNVIENAVRYGDRARVGLAESGGQAIISVEDDGPGIPAEKRDAVFEPFVRLEESRSRETGGVGLGLAIARTIMRAHGGDIALDQAESGGLRVVLTVPIG